MITKCQLTNLNEAVLDHLIKHGTIAEVIATARGVAQGAREDYETAKHHRGKLGAALGVGGTWYLMRKANKAATKAD